MIVRWEQGRSVIDDLLTRGPGAFVLSYDAARKALSAIFLNQGLRSGGDGAHAVLLQVVRAQLDPPLGTLFRPFSWMRPLRNHTEYPSPDHPIAQTEDVTEAIPAATAMIDAATKVIDKMPPY